jgi:putative protease
MVKFKKPELVSPAGDWCSLYSAVEAGADSVYFGVKGLNMRNLASNFDILEIKKVMDFLRKNNKKGYLALNVIVFNKEINKVKKILREAKKHGVNAVILWDMAVFSLAKEMGLNIHLSTQASVSNFEALKHYSSQGVNRAVLARECNLEDIADIIKQLRIKKINCEIEAFIHGAMCVSISGRCFLSQYWFSKSANRGECIQPCRREFLITDTQEDSSYVIGKDYLLSPKDLCSIDFIDKLIKAGIGAFKIEGRIRSAEYIKVVTSVYRQAIDSFFEGKLDEKLKKKLKAQLRKVYNRGFSDGFYFGVPQGAVSRRLENSYEKVFVGQVRKCYKKIKVAEVLIQDNPLGKGADVLLVSKDDPVRFAKVDSLQINHVCIDKAQRGQTVGVKFPFIVKPKTKVFLWRKKITS